MDLLHLVDRLEELVGNAQKMPIGNRAMVDRRRLLDIIDQMRIVIPPEVREAQEIVARRDGVIREAEEEGRLIIAHAEEQAARLVDTHDITERARARAEEIADQARTRLEEELQRANVDIAGRLDESRQIAQDQMGAADEYALELLRRLDRQLQAFVRSVGSGIEQLQPNVPPPFDLSSLTADEPDRGGEAAGLGDREAVAAGIAASESYESGGGDQPEAAAYDFDQQAAAVGEMPVSDPSNDEADWSRVEVDGGRWADLPQAGATQRSDAAPVIDDFAMPQLDDAARGISAALPDEMADLDDLEWGPAPVEGDER